MSDIFLACAQTELQFCRTYVGIETTAEAGEQRTFKPHNHISKGHKCSFVLRKLCESKGLAIERDKIAQAPKDLPHPPTRRHLRLHFQSTSPDSPDCGLLQSRGVG